MKRNKIAPNLPAKANSGLPVVRDEDLPAVIQGQVQKLNELDESVKKAVVAAKKAEEAAKKAEDKKVTFWGGRKEAIEELQTAGMSIADAVASGAKAQKVSFEFQTKLAEITKYLFGLGISNIAANRIVVRELELRLNGASKEKLSDLARQEMLMVVKQLKDQEDILVKQEELEKSVKSHNNKFKSQSEKYKMLEDELQDLTETVRKHESKIRTIVKNTRNQTRQLKDLLTECALFDEQIKTLIKNDKCHGEHLKNLLKKCDEYDATFDTMTKDISIYRTDISKKIFIAFAIGGLGALLGLLGLIILILQ